MPKHNLAQLVSEAVARHGGSIAAFARAHAIPYLSLTKLINDGQPPRRASVLNPLEQALGVSHESFMDALHASREEPVPASQVDPSLGAKHPLHARILQACAERELTQMGFAEATGLSIVTAAHIMKGELPSRHLTNEKIRAFLGLDQVAYNALLVATRKAMAGQHDDHDEHAPTPAHPAQSSTQPKTGSYPQPKTGAITRNTQSPAELMALWGRLTPPQAEALLAFLRTLPAR